MIKPIYSSLSEKLEKHIRENKLSGRLPGINLLCKEFGVHQVTMSKAVKLLEKKGILTVNSTRGTFINDKADCRPVYKVIGIVGFNYIQKHEGFINILNSVTEKSGYAAIGITIPPNCFEKNPELLANFPVDGFLFCCSSLTVNVARYLHRTGIPFVACNRRPDLDWISTVDFDHEAIFGSVTKYLESRGHRRIAYVSPLSVNEYQHHVKWMRDIICGTQQDHFRKEYFYTFPIEWRELSGHRDFSTAVERMLEYFGALPKAPTVVIAPALIAGEVIRQLEQSGLKCPDDLSVFFYGATSGVSADIAGAYFDYDKLCLAGTARLIRQFGNQSGKAHAQLLNMPVIPGASVGKVSDMVKFKNVWNGIKNRRKSHEYSNGGEIHQLPVS